MGRHSDALLARAVNVALAPKYSQKSRAVSERAAMNFATPPLIPSRQLRVSRGYNLAEIAEIRDAPGFWRSVNHLQPF
jgi:hypothetical protein